MTSHHNPDGDAIGSVLAMYHFLRPLVDDLQVIVPNGFPGFLQWLPGHEHIMLYERKVRTAKKIIADADLIFCLDYNSLHRAGDMAEVIRTSKAERFMIDHHPQPALAEFHLHLSLIQTSSTAELVYRFIQECMPETEISQSLAVNLFVGIMTDTGSFSYACNYPETFTVAAELIQAGVDVEWVHRMVYDTYSEDRLRLLGYSLSQKMVILRDFKTAYISLSKKELEDYRYQVGDTEGLVNYALSIDGVVLAVLLTERKDRVRLSFRSKGDFSANRIAREHFQGGGHLNAAGGDSFESLENTITKLETVLEQYKDEIHRSSY